MLQTINHSSPLFYFPSFLRESQKRIFRLKNEKKNKTKKTKKKTDAKWLYVYWKEENVIISFFCNLKQNFTNIKCHKHHQTSNVTSHVKSREVLKILSLKAMSSFYKQTLDYKTQKVNIIGETLISLCIVFHIFAG